MKEGNLITRFHEEVALIEDGDLPEDSDESYETNAVVRATNSLLQYALEEGHTNIEIICQQEGDSLKVGSAPGSMEAIPLPNLAYSQLKDHLKYLADLKVSEQKAAQHGRIGITFNEQPFDLFVETTPLSGGEKLVVNFVPFVMKRQR